MCKSHSCVIFLTVLFPQLYYTFLKYKYGIYLLSHIPHSTYYRATCIIGTKKYLLLSWTQEKQFILMVASLYSHVAPLTI